MHRLKLILLTLAFFAGLNLAAPIAQNVEHRSAPDIEHEISGPKVDITT
jgi:hypothetical protein